MTSPTAVIAPVDSAIERAQASLLAAQGHDGHWVGELEANTTITSEYLLFCHLTGRVDREREGKIVTYLRREQLPDGGLSIYHKGPANLSATIKAYFAMKVAGVPVDDPAMASARARIRTAGGPTEAGGFTQVLRARLGEEGGEG